MIYVTGDTHMPIDIHKLSTRCFPAQKSLTPDDYVIICGDFGGIWDDSAEERYWLKWLTQKNFTTLFLDGNHENFDRLAGFPEVDFCGGRAHRISGKLLHLMRGQLYTMDGLRLFTLGGASSHDKAFRTEGKNWWPAELPAPAELDAALRTLDAAGWQVDYVLTHCAPTGVQRQLFPHYAPDELTDFLDMVDARLSFRKWYFGHYHIDAAPDCRHRALFQDVIPLDGSV